MHMKENGSSRQLIISVVACTALVVFAKTIYGAFESKPDEISVEKRQDDRSFASRFGAQNYSAEQPIRLKIPSVGINAKVQDVGVGKSGNVAVPTNYSDAGWYRYGPRPGENGNAIINGHVNNGFALPGVFWRLEKLERGDRIIVTDSQGKDAVFIVLSTAMYPTDDAPVEDIFRTEGKPGLVLITCGGTWLPSENTYDHRFVVFAELSQG